MARSHAPFAMVNRMINPVVRAVLRSPAHGLLSRQVALITVIGRRSGRSFTFPVQYRQRGATVTICVGSPERKRWWRNLQDGAPVTLLLRGARHTGTARTEGNPHTGLIVRVELDDEVPGP